MDLISFTRLPTTLMFLSSVAYHADSFSIPNTHIHSRHTTNQHCPSLLVAKQLSHVPLFSTSIDTDVDISDLPLPPNLGQNIYRSIRDSFSYLINPDRFVADRSARLGPVFLTYQFFKPTVFVGGKEAVSEFISGTELKSKVIYPSLPDSFVDLHTKWGALNMDATESMFKEARMLFGDVLSSRMALEQYSQAADREIQEYVDDLARRVKENPDRAIYLAPELKSLCLQIFSKIFSGEGLSKEQERQFEDYNAALLTLSMKSQTFKKGKAALEDLRVEMLRRFRALDDPNIPADTPGKWYHDQIYGRKNFDNEERISTGIILFIWGAYVECASLCVHSLAFAYMNGLQDKIAGVRKEYAARKATGISLSNPKFWMDMPYTNGICRETLRLAPPSAGVPRYSKEDFRLAGYRIPAGTPVMLEPRVGNNDPNLYKDPKQFQPMRWVPVEASNNTDSPSSSCPLRGTALNLGTGTWFPGGFGAHQCPGVPLAELVGRMLLAKMSLKFDSWAFSGEGLTKDGEIDFINIPVKIAPDNFGMLFTLRESD